MNWIVGYGDGLTGPTTAGCGAVFCGGVDWEFVPISYGRETIALVPQQRGENGLKEMHKHAKLIAAAPDLLEALVAISSSHPEVAMASDDELRASIMHCDDPIGVAQAGALLKARAAIKKATE